MEPTVSPQGKPSFEEVHAGLQKEIPRRFWKQRVQGGAKIDYVPWAELNRLLLHITRGWFSYRIADKRFFVERDLPFKGKVTNVHRILLTVQVTLHTTDGDFTYEGTGIEDVLGDSYGDFQSNAEAMAFRRALARMGFGLAGWLKDE